MQSGVEQSEYEAYLLPIDSIGRTALLSGAFSLIPVFVALIWLTRPSPFCATTAAIEFGITTSFLVLFWRFRRVFAGVTADRFVFRGLLPKVRSVELSRIDRLYLNSVYRSHSADSLVQLVAIDARGRRLFRLSGMFWPEEGIIEVANALGIKTTIDSVPVSKAAYYRRIPAARRWFERRQVGAGFLVVATLVVITLLSLVERIARRG